LQLSTTSGRSGRHNKRLDAVLLATVNMLAKDEPLPHRDFDHPLGGDME
jgi:hypothetical protein